MEIFDRDEVGTIKISLWKRKCGIGNGYFYTVSAVIEKSDKQHEGRKLELIFNESAVSSGRVVAVMLRELADSIEKEE